MSFFQTIFAATDTIFWIFALSGTFLFIIQSVLNFIGTDLHDDGSDGFHWITKQALTGFLMMFGWVGLTCRKELDFSIWQASLAALAGGILSFFASGAIFNLAKRLRSPGMVFRIEDAIGKQAIVYQRIPKDGAGKVSLSINNLTFELDAICPSGELSSFTQVQIINKTDGKTVVVVPVK